MNSIPDIDLTLDVKLLVMGFSRIDRFLTSEQSGESEKIFIETDQIWDGEGLEEGPRQELYRSLSDSDYSSAIVLVKGDPYELDLTGFDDTDYRASPEGEIEDVDPASDIIDEIEDFYRDTY